MSRHAAPPDRRKLLWSLGAVAGGLCFALVAWFMTPSPDAPDTGFPRASAAEEVRPTGTPSQSGSPKPSVTRTPSPKASAPTSRPTTTRPTPTPTRTSPRPSTTPPRPPVTPKPSATPVSMTNHALYLINGERKEAGLSMVAVYSGMGGYAQDWAEEMDRADVLVHSSNNPYSAEVIAVGTDGMTAAQAVEAWMQSPPHREIILNPAYNKVGIGHSGGYWCAVFG